MPRVVDDIEFPDEYTDEQIKAILRRKRGLPSVKPIAAASTAPGQPQPQGSSIGRFAKGVSRTLIEPAAEMVGGGLKAASEGAFVPGTRRNVELFTKDLPNIGHGIVQQAGEEIKKERLARQRGGIGGNIEALGHAAAAGFPMVGPSAAGEGERIGEGDIAGGLGGMTGLLLPFILGKAGRLRRAGPVAEGAEGAPRVPPSASPVTPGETLRPAPAPGAAPPPPVSGGPASLGRRGFLQKAAVGAAGAAIPSGAGTAAAPQAGLVPKILDLARRHAEAAAGMRADPMNAKRMMVSSIDDANISQLMYSPEMWDQLGPGIKEAMGQLQGAVDSYIGAENPAMTARMLVETATDLNGARGNYPRSVAKEAMLQARKVLSGKLQASPETTPALFELGGPMPSGVQSFLPEAVQNAKRAYAPIRAARKAAKAGKPAASPDLQAAADEAAGAMEVPPEMKQVLDSAPPPAEGTTRLYRGEGPLSQKGGNWFTTNPGEGISYQQGGDLHYTDVPTERLQQMNAEMGRDPSMMGEFQLPDGYVAQAQRLGEAAPAAPEAVAEAHNAQIQQQAPPGTPPVPPAQPPGGGGEAPPGGAVPPGGNPPPGGPAPAPAGRPALQLPTVPLTVGERTGSRVAKGVESALESSFPGAKTFDRFRIGQQESLQRMADTVVKDISDFQGSPEELGTKFQSDMEAVSQGLKAEAGNAYGEIDDLAQGTFTDAKGEIHKGVRPKTALIKSFATDALKDLKQKGKLIPSTETARAEAILKKLSKAPDEVSFSTMADARSELMSITRRGSGGGFISDRNIGTIKKITQLIDESMENAAKSNPELLKKFRDTNAQWRDIHDTFDRSVVARMAKAPPEKVTSFLRGASLEDIDRLRKVTPPETWDAMRSQVVRSIFDEATEGEVARSFLPETVQRLAGRTPETRIKMKGGKLKTILEDKYGHDRLQRIFADHPEQLKNVFRVLETAEKVGHTPKSLLGTFVNFKMIMGAADAALHMSGASLMEPALMMAGGKLLSRLMTKQWSATVLQQWLQAGKGTAKSTYWAARLREAIEADEKREASKVPARKQ